MAPQIWPPPTPPIPTAWRSPQSLVWFIIIIVRFITFVLLQFWEFMKRWITLLWKIMYQHTLLLLQLPSHIHSLPVCWAKLAGVWPEQRQLRLTASPPTSGLTPCPTQSPLFMPCCGWSGKATDVHHSWQRGPWVAVKQMRDADSLRSIIQIIEKSTIQNKW